MFGNKMCKIIVIIAKPLNHNQVSDVRVCCLKIIFTHFNTEKCGWINGKMVGGDF